MFFLRETFFGVEVCSGLHLHAGVLIRWDLSHFTTPTSEIRAVKARLAHSRLALFLFIRSLEVTLFYLFVCGSMPSLVSSTAKEHLQLSIMTFYLPLYLPNHPCPCTCVGTPGGSEPADKYAFLC